MAKPRIFVSSTFYDLKHVRASLDLFIESLGFEPVLSEKGDISYLPDQALDLSCYREAESADIFVLLVGGRYGSIVSGVDRKVPGDFYEQYESITRREFETAAKRDVPIYILIEKGVYSEYQTYLRNRDNQGITYAHVDSVNVFRFIGDILSKPRNNPVHTFERFEEIHEWLREQWAGLFRELLGRLSQQQQLAGLTAQISELRSVNETLKTYLEAVMTRADKSQAKELIESEAKRLEEQRRYENLRFNGIIRFITEGLSIDIADVAHAIQEATGFDDFASKLKKMFGPVDAHRASSVRRLLRKSDMARTEVNMARAALGCPPFQMTEPKGLTNDAGDDKW